MRRLIWIFTVCTWFKIHIYAMPISCGGGRVVRWPWVNFPCRGVLLIWTRLGQGPTALAVGAGGGCLDSFSPVYQFSSLSPSPWETARHTELLSQRVVKPKTTNKPIKPISCNQEQRKYVIRLCCIQTGE